MLEAFAQSILNGTEMAADGIEGINSLSISNAAYLSSWTNDWTQLPTDEALFEKYLKELCQKEQLKNKTVHIENNEKVCERWKVRW